MLPATLDQYSRSRLTHYTGYKPRAGSGATAVQPAHGPTAETTQGFVNLQVGPAPSSGLSAGGLHRTQIADPTTVLNACIKHIH